MCPLAPTTNLTPPSVVQHMTTYWAILEKVRGSSLRLTKIDDEIYEHLKADFPEFDPAAVVDEDEMKSKTGKERWRKFMMAYENKIDDFNFGTMVRNAASVEYGKEETIFGMFYRKLVIAILADKLILQSHECSSTLSRSHETAMASTIGSMSKTIKGRRRGRRKHKWRVLKREEERFQLGLFAINKLIPSLLYFKGREGRSSGHRSRPAKPSPKKTTSGIITGMQSDYNFIGTPLQCEHLIRCLMGRCCTCFISFSIAGSVRIVILADSPPTLFIFQFSPMTANSTLKLN